MVDVEDRPGVLADLTRRIAKAGVDLDLVYARATAWSSARPTWRGSARRSTGAGRWRCRALIVCAALLVVLPAAPASANHATATLQVSARLGERLSDNSWAVIVDWSITCSGPAPGQANYTGSLNLDDVDSGEVLYMGGTAGASGSDAQPVTRRSAPRTMRPRIKASCFDSGPGNHGSDTTEVVGNAVVVPSLGDELIAMVCWTVAFPVTTAPRARRTSRAPASAGRGTRWAPAAAPTSGWGRNGPTRSMGRVGRTSSSASERLLHPRPRRRRLPRRRRRRRSSARWQRT